MTMIDPGMATAAAEPPSAHDVVATSRAGDIALRVLIAVAPPLVFGVVFVALWEGAVKVFDWRPYFLPPPSRVWSEFTGNLGLIREATWVSGGNALIGLLVGAALGIAVSFLLMRFQVLHSLVTPLAIALNAVPIVVLVAVFNGMFATTSPMPRRLMVTLIVYFVILINVAKGLRQVQAVHVELLRSYAASPTQVLVKARIPNAVSYFFTALKIAAPLAVITAFVAEYFGGTQNGLGSRIVSNISSSRNATALAYVVGACLLGLAFYLAAVALEAIITRQRGRGPGGGTP